MSDETYETQYVAVGDADVAFQVVGDGPFDLVCFYGLGSQIDLLRDLPPVPVDLFSPFARTIEFDRRGNGASDALPRGGLPQWEDWADDVGAVLDAAGSDRAVLYAETDAGPIALLYAATHPERVSGLVLVNTTARYSLADDYPIGLSRDVLEQAIAFVERTWGTASFVRALHPELAENDSRCASSRACFGPPRPRVPPPHSCATYKTTSMFATSCR
jgi:pimeloyl-ACP methyl ester carboxylesterase